MMALSVLSTPTALCPPARAGTGQLRRSDMFIVHETKHNPLKPRRGGMTGSAACHAAPTELAGVIASAVPINMSLLRSWPNQSRQPTVLSTPTALCPSAQGCEATLGGWGVVSSQPQRGCSTGARRTQGCNPVGVDGVGRASPRVVPRTAQPWAEGWNPVGILRRGRAWNGGAKCQTWNGGAK